MFCLSILCLFYIFAFLCFVVLCFVTDPKKRCSLITAQTKRQLHAVNAQLYGFMYTHFGVVKKIMSLTAFCIEVSIRGEWGMKMLYANGFSHMTKMAAMPRYGKTL